MKSTNSAFFAVSAALQLCSATLHSADLKIPAATNPPTSGQSKDLDHRLKWNLDSLVGDYERHGRRNPKWDEAAKAGLTLFAQVRAFSDSPQGNELWMKVAGPIKAAVTNGCDDPMVGYLYARYVKSQESHTDKEQADAFRSAAEALSKSEYASIRKFYAALRAAIVLNPGGTNTPPEVHKWRRQASHDLNEAVKDKTMPAQEVYEACDQLLQAVKPNSPQHVEFYQALEPTIFKNWPSESSLFLLKGRFYIDYGWHARGTAYANKVTEEGWRLFQERLAEAETALDKAWELNPRDERIACEMISLELGQGKGRDRMELWFKRATDLCPNYYDAFARKINYLQPKWYGSPEDMLEFGRECVESEKVAGRIPLILREAHEALVLYLDKADRPSYWKRPEVWKDIKAAFEKFFKLNPDEIGWRHNYALYAYRAEQWDDLNRQLPLLGEINYKFFGGKEEFEKMVRLAREHAKK